MPSTTIRTILHTSLATALVLGASVAAAQPASFSSLAGFTAGFGSTASNDLNALANGATVISFGALGTGTLSGATVTGGSITNPGTFSITFSQLLNGFAADFFQTNANTAESVKLTFFNGATNVGGSELGAFGSNFFGARPCCGSFNRVEITNGTTYAGGFLRADNLAVGFGPAATTAPEPATVVLFASGLAVLGGVATRRRRTRG